MKELIRIIPAFIILFLSTHAALSAQGGDKVSFGHLSVEDGLPHTHVEDRTDLRAHFRWETINAVFYKIGVSVFVIGSVRMLSLRTAMRWFTNKFADRKIWRKQAAMPLPTHKSKGNHGG